MHNIEEYVQTERAMYKKQIERQLTRCYVATIPLPFSMDSPPVMEDVLQYMKDLHDESYPRSPRNSLNAHDSNIGYGIQEKFTQE